MLKSFWFHAVLVCAASLASPALAGQKPNVLLICIDDLRPELGCYGQDYVHSPNIDALAARARIFARHFVQAPTCGASRYALLTGRYGPSGNGALFERSRRLQKNPERVPASMPAWFRKHGYSTVSVGKVSHHPGGRGGKDWNDDTVIEMPESWDRHLMPVGPWQHPRGAMHGLAHGEIRVRAGQMDVFQAAVGGDDIYPDGLIVNESISQMKRLAASDSPFFMAVGIIRPHLPFGAPRKYLEQYAGAQLPAILHPGKPDDRTTWHGSGEFMKYNRWGRNPNTDEAFATEVRRHYAACVSYADAQVGRVLKALEECGAAQETVVVLWGDHGWHLGEHAIWGKHALFDESLHSPLIIAPPGLENPGAQADGLVETIDVFPTLCDVAGLPAPEHAHGRSLLRMLRDPAAPGHPAASYARATTLRTDSHRLVTHKDGYMELYDHRTPEKETRNVADTQPEVAAKMLARLRERLKNRD